MLFARTLVVMYSTLIKLSKSIQTELRAALHATAFRMNAVHENSLPLLKSTPVNKNRLNNMLRLCYQRGMPKPPPANIYKLYVSHQLKAGRKLADIALTWKTSVTETEKESLRAQLDQINLAFKKALTEWAISKHLPPLDSHKKLAEAYCIKNHLAPEVILPLSNDHSESGTDNVNPQNAEPKANERGLEYPSNSEDLIEAASIAQHDPHRLWLGGIPPRTTEYAILQLTRQFGQLSDFHFPVHRAGELQGSTVGYCFVTYKEEDAASKALKLLNGLNFHGHRLVARHAHPTRDEITIAQRASEEAARLRIAEQARLCETKLAARLMQVDGADLTTDQCGPVLILSNHKKSDEDENTNFSERPTEVLPDMCGKLGRIGPSKPPKAMTEPHTASTSSRNACNPERPSRTTAAINRIESALRHLEKNPVGGVELLQPSALKPPLPITYSVLANAKARNAPRGGYSHSRLRSGGYHQGSHYIGERGRRSKCTDQTKTIYSRL